MMGTILNRYMWNISMCRLWTKGANLKWVMLSLMLLSLTLSMSAGLRQRSQAFLPLLTTSTSVDLTHVRFWGSICCLIRPGTLVLGLNVNGDRSFIQTREKPHLYC